MVQPNRRHFFRTAVGGVCLQGISRTWGAEGELEGYVRANTDWLAKCRFGIGVHWTAQSVPSGAHRSRSSRPLTPSTSSGSCRQSSMPGPTTCCSLRPTPCRCSLLRIRCSTRSCRTDLRARPDRRACRWPGRQGRAAAGLLQPPCNSKDDPPWEQAVGYHDQNKGRFAQNLLEIVGWRANGTRTRSRRGGSTARIPWILGPAQQRDHRHDRLSVSLGTVHGGRQDRASARLVTYNAGVNETFLYTTHQDYWAG